MKTTIASFLMLLVTVLVSCHKKETPKNIIVPVDFSASRDSIAIAWYKETIKNAIIRNMGVEDRITVLPVDGGSELWSQEVFSYDFSKNKYTNEYAGLQADDVKRENFRDTAAKAMALFEQAFDRAVAERKQLSQVTDIFGSLRLTKKYVLTGHQNVLILFSDMQQSETGEELNLEKKVLTKPETETFLKKAVPVDLKGTDIIVLTGSQTNVTPEKFSALQTFWTKYFDKCGARAIDYSTGTAIKLEERLKSN
ncbi:MAG: hypothetical protein U0U70_01890 [Chitinophagaceae bacterium]